MNSDRDRVSDGKLPRRRSGGGGGSKKSSRTPSSRKTAGAVDGVGGDRVRAGPNREIRRDSRDNSVGVGGGGGVARPDYLPPSGAQGKDSRAEGAPSRSRSGAKATRRGSGRADAGGEGRNQGRPERSQQEEQLAEYRTAGPPPGNVDRAILDKWKREASAANGDMGGAARDGPPSKASQETPEEVVEDGNGYDDEGFEEYSDEFEGEGDEVPPATAPVVAVRSATARRGGAGAGAGGGGGGGRDGGGGAVTAGPRSSSGSRVVSPALKMRQADDIQTPDDKALQELRNSLQEENTVARERQVARPLAEASISADAKPPGQTATRGAKGSKGSKGSKGAGGPAAATEGGRESGAGGGGGIARGTFSVQGPAEGKGGARTGARSSAFKMADAKELTRALKKGDPRVTRVLAIRSASRLEVESVRLFDQPPVAPIDLYYRRLRGQPPSIRQAATQTNEDARSVDTQTDEIVLADKEVQFHLGHDDTALENLMRRLRSCRGTSPAAQEAKRHEGDPSSELTRTEEDAAGSTTVFRGLYRSGSDDWGDASRFPQTAAAAASAMHHARDSRSGGSGSGGGGGGGAASFSKSTLPPRPQRLGNFLRQACVVMETLCEENLLTGGAAGRRGGGKPDDPAEASDDNDGDGRPSLFQTGTVGKGWEEAGSCFEVTGSRGTWGGGTSRSATAAAATNGEGEGKTDTTNGRSEPRLGLGSLLDGVDVVGVAFSKVKRSMLVTAHASTAQREPGDGSVAGLGGARGELRPVLEGCGVVCVWNVENVTGAPSSVLYGEGIFSCLCLALRQPHVVVVGTAEGCLLLWDLREPMPSSRSEVEGYLRLPSRVAHVSLSPVDPRRGSVCCVDGTSLLVDFPAVVSRSPPVVHLQRAADFTTPDSAKVSVKSGAGSGGGAGIRPVSASVEAEACSAGRGRGLQQQQSPHMQKEQKRKKTGGELTLVKGHAVGKGGQEQTEDERGRDKRNEFRGDGAILDSVATAAGVSGATAEDVHRFSYGGFDRSRNSAMSVDIQEDADVAAAPGAGANIGVSASLRLDVCGIGGTCAGTSKTEAGGIFVGNVADGVAGDGGGEGDVEKGFGITCGERKTGASETWHTNSSTFAVNTDRAEVRGTYSVDARRARTIKIWDPVKQLELFSAATTSQGRSSGCFTTGLGFGCGSHPRTGVVIDTEADASASGEAPLSTGGAGSSGSGGGSSKSASRAPVQPGRTAWCEDGETLFILSHEGNLLKIKASVNGDLSLLAKADLHGGASPATLQLTTEGDKVLVATATKGLCLVPTDDLDLSRAEMFGETFGMRGSKTRFWGSAILADVHGRGSDGAGIRRQTIVGNPSRSRDEKTALFFFDPIGGQPERVDTPRREGVICLAGSSLRPLLVLLCPTGEVYLREEVLKTDFPGPWYPSGYVLIDNNVDYLEAEDQLDTVVTIGPNNEILSKTQAHDVVVPWQHQAVSEEAFAGRTEAPVDVIGGGDNGSWENASPDELRWMPPNEKSGTLLGEDDEGTGGPMGSPRAAGQENFAGPIARLLGATPALLKEARKRTRASTVSDEDAALKRREMVSKMMETLAAKKKKYDEEAVKRKRKLEESRAKAKRLRQKKAAASEEKAAERAASARRSAAEREEVSRQEAAPLMSEVAAAAGKEVAATTTVPEGRSGVAAEQQRARELETHSPKERRGEGGRITVSTGMVPTGSADGACGYGPRQHPYWAPKTPAMGISRNTRIMKDGWRDSGSGGIFAGDSHPSTCGVAAGTAMRVPPKSAAAKEHHDTAAKTSRVVAGGTDMSKYSTSLAKRPGGALSNPSATGYDASSSLFSHLTETFSEQRKATEDRRPGGKRAANSGSSVQWPAADPSEPSRGVDGSTESVWRSADPPPEVSPTLWGGPGSSEALYVLPTTQANKKEGRWGSPGAPEGAWAAASAAAAVALAAEAREEAARGISPTESVVSTRRCFHGDEGAGDVENGPDGGGARERALRPSFSSSRALIDGNVGGPHRSGGGGGSIEASACNETVLSQTISRSTVVVASSGRPMPLTRGSLSPPLSRGVVPHNHPSSSGTHYSPPLRHLSPAPGASWRQLPLPLSPPHTSQGVPMLAEALAHRQTDATVALPTASAVVPARLQLEPRRSASARGAPVGEGRPSETATSHNSWVKDLTCSATSGTGDRGYVGENRGGVGILASAVARQQHHHKEGKGLRDGDTGAGDLELNASAVSPHDHAVAPLNMASASVTSIAGEEQLGEGGLPRYPSPDSMSVLGPAAAEGSERSTWED